MNKTVEEAEDEVEPDTNEGDVNKIEFKSEPRKFTIDDIEDLQHSLRNLNDKSIKKGIDYILSDDWFYVDMIQTPQSKNNHEKKASENIYDDSIADLTKSLPSPYNDIKSLSELKKFYDYHYSKDIGKYKDLRSELPLTFQGHSPGDKENQFVHVRTGRSMGLHTNYDITDRFYLNPTADKTGDIVHSLVKAAQDSKTPLYFKFTDIASPDATEGALKREDRVVIYASKDQKDFVEKTLKNIIADNEEAFAGRPVGGYSQKIYDGVSIASEVTDKQKKFGKKHSFNTLRSKMLTDVVLNVTEETVKKYGDLYIDGRSIKDIRKEVQDQILKRRKLSVEEVKKKPYSEQKEILDVVWKKLSKKILPKVDSKTLLPMFEKNIQDIAPKYYIDPNDLSRNLE